MRCLTKNLRRLVRSALQPGTCKRRGAAPGDDGGRGGEAGPAGPRRGFTGRHSAAPCLRPLRRAPGLACLRHSRRGHCRQPQALPGTSGPPRAPQPGPPSPRGLPPQDGGRVWASRGECWGCSLLPAPARLAAREECLNVGEACSFVPLPCKYTQRPVPCKALPSARRPHARLHLPRQQPAPAGLLHRGDCRRGRHRTPTCSPPFARGVGGSGGGGRCCAPSLSSCIMHPAPCWPATYSHARSAGCVWGRNGCLAQVCRRRRRQLQGQPAR